MTIASWALVISLGSLLLSIASLGWNIWSKFMAPKPRIDVKLGWRASVVTEADKRRGTIDEAVAAEMEVTNFGPGRVVLASVVQTVMIERRNEKGGTTTGHLNLMTEAFGGNRSGPSEYDLPLSLDMGERVVFYFSPSNLWLYEELRDQVFLGVEDTWRRVHLTSRNDVLKFFRGLDKLFEDYPKESSPLPVNER